MQPEQIAHLGIARSFQITSLFDQMTLVEHVELTLRSPTGLGYRFWKSSKRMGQFRERSRNCSTRSASPTPPRPRVLAYGQKRALELALALALDPRLLLLDEPTAGMGMEDVDRTIALVKKVAGGRTVIFVDHNMHVVGSLADTVTVLQSGQILAEGTYEQVRNDEKVITGLPGAGSCPRTWRTALPVCSRSTASRRGTARPGPHRRLTRVRPGEVVTLVGRNGAGKTTLLRSIMGLHRQVEAGSGSTARSSAGARRTPVPRPGSAGCRTTAASTPASRWRRTSPCRPS